MRISLNRRCFLVLAATTPVVGLLAACGGSSSSTPTSASGGTAGGGAAQPTLAAIPTSAPAPQSFGVTPNAATGGTPSASPAASPAASGGGTVKNVDFIVVDGTEPTSLDPSPGTGPFQHIINALYDNLVSWNPQMQVDPALATAWSASSDGKQWTFKLRPNVKFHDGTPFNANAVKVTFDHVLHGKQLASRRASYTLIKEVQTPNDLTAVLVIDPATPDLPFLLADGSAKIISQANLQKWGDTDIGQHPVGTGPFKFEEWVPNDHISAVINPDYWGTKPLVRRFIYKPIPEAATRVIVLKNGEADVVFNLPPADVAELQKDANLQVMTDPGLTVVECEPKMTQPPFSKKEVRYALNQAIDKDAIIKNVMRGYAKPLKTPDCPGLWGAFEFDIPPYDPDKAKQLLAQAGYPNGIDVTLAYVSGRWAGDDQVAQAVQGYWNQVGIRTTIKKIDMGQLGPNLSADPDQNPGLAVMPIRTSLYSDYQLFRMYQSGAANANASQRSGYSNPEVDKLIAQEQSEFDQNKRLEIFKQLQQVIWEDQPFVYLFSQLNLWGKRKNVSGFTVLPSNDLVPGAIQKT